MGTFSDLTCLEGHSFIFHFIASSCEDFNP